MVNILSNIDGRKVGVAADVLFGGAMIPGRQISVGGYTSGPHGLQIDHPSPFRAVFFDEFYGNAIRPEWVQRKGTNNPAAPAPLSGGLGGILQLIAGTAGTGLAADENSVVQTLQYEAQYGGIEIQARVKLSLLTNMWCFIGFCDTAASLQTPIQSAGAADTFTSNSTDACGFMYDDSMATKHWWATGVANAVAAANFDTKVAPVAAQFQTLRMGIDGSGNGFFFINGLPVGSKLSDAVTKTVPLTPIIAWGANSANTAARNLQVDYCAAAMVRNSDGAAA